MKRVGIITFHRALNYGAVLQAYALQQVLQKDGLDCDVIDMRNDRVDLHYSGRIPRFSASSNLVSSIRIYLAAWKHFPEEKRRRVIFDDFLKEKIKLSRSCDSIDTLEAVSKEYDFFFCGSDQVWNLGCTTHNSAYFLSFTEPSKRNSYAASIGTAHISDDNVNEYKSNLSGFNHISVREEASINEIKRIVGKEAIWVLDPTMLLSKEDWESCAEPINVPSDYILVYMLYDVANKDFISFVERISEEKQLPVVIIGKNKKISLINKIEILPTPRQWVWLFLNAKLVITNSYHGTLFSINFQREFYTGLLIPKERSANVRILGILGYCRLNERIIPYDNVNLLDICSKIEWESVCNKIERMKKQSIDFIRKVEGDYM